MSYNILNKNVNFQGDTQGTIEDIVDLHTDQTVGGKKTITHLTASNLSVTNNLGIGTVNPEGNLHIYSGDAGIAPSNLADELVVEGAGSVGISILTTNSQVGRLYFGDSDNSARGYLLYDHSIDMMKFSVASGNRLIINNLGNVGIGTTSPSTRLHVDGNITTTNLTASGTVAATGVISGSSAISGSKFFGDGSALTGVGVSLAAGSGLTNSGGLRVDPSQSTAIAGSINDSDNVTVYSTADSAPRKVTVADIAGRATVPISTYTNTGGNANRVIVSIDGSGVVARTNLTFDNSDLLLTGNMSGSGDFQIGGNITGSAQLVMPNIATGSIAGPGSFLALNAAGKVVLTENLDVAVNIDSYSALGGTGLHQTEDHFIFSDNGTEKKITFSNLEDAIFANISSDATIAAGGALTIADNAVSLAKMAGLARGKIIVGDSSGDPSALTLGSAGQVLVSDGDDLLYRSLSGDATLGADGTLTIAANAVEGSMLNSNVAGSGLDYGSNQLSVDVSDFLTNGVDNRIVTATGTDGLNAEANLTFDGDDLQLSGSFYMSGSATFDVADFTIVSDDTSKPTFLAKDTADDINSAAYLKFSKLPSSATYVGDGKAIGIFQWTSLRSNSTENTYAQMFTRIWDDTAGAHAGKFDFQVWSNASSEILLSVQGARQGSLPCEVIVNDDGADCNFRVESDTNTHAFFIDGTSGDIGLGAENESGTFMLMSGSNDELIFQVKQQGNGYPTMFLGGENHASYPGLFYNRGQFLNLGAISQGNLAGNNGSNTKLTIRKTSIADNSATSIVTFTIPNANHAAGFKVFGFITTDSGSRVGTFEQGIAISRIAGSVAATAGSTRVESARANSGGSGADFTISTSLAQAGAASASNTVDYQLTIDTTDGSSTNAVIYVELLNFNDSGITMAAS